MVEWMQTIEGALTMTFGGVSVMALAAMVISLIRTGKISGMLANWVEAIKQTAATMKTILGVNEQKELIILQKEQEAEELFEAIKVIMSTLAIIAAASTGVGELAKIEILNEIKAFETKIENHIKERTAAAKELLKNITEEAADKGQQFLSNLNQGAEDTKEIVSQTLNQVSDLISKYSKR